MTLKEARKEYMSFDRDTKHTKEEEFYYTECMEYLIHEEPKSEYMLALGGYYYELRKFDLALKYYEMAAAYDDTEAYLCLGYIWYYGRTGETNYEKAFYNYSEAMKRGNINGAYKVADMYKNGYFVEKSYDTYCSIIEDLYPKVKDARYLGEHLPEVFTRLARIRAEQGKKDEAIDLYLRAKDFLAQRIRYNPFFGNRNIMKWLIEDLYKLMEFDSDFFDFYDLYLLLQSPVRVRFHYEDRTLLVEALEENGECVIRFGGRWFRTVDDFFAAAELDGELLTDNYDDFYGFEVI